MKKIVIYSCITANYDVVQQPCQAPEDFDFILFVPRGTKKAGSDGAWRIEELPVSWEDPVITSRFPKMCPQTLLEDYEYSLWLDANVGIVQPDVFDICREMARRGVQYAGIRHPYRDCVYEECETVLKDRRETLCRLMHIVRFLHSNGLPAHAGLMENNVIFRRHNDETVVEFDRLWWDWFLSHSPRRDQMVHTICLKEVPLLKVEHFLPVGVTARNSGMFNYVRHPAPELTWLQRKLKYGLNKPEGFILRCYIKILFFTNPKI